MPARAPLVALLFIAVAAGPAAAARPALPYLQGPKVPPVTAPARVLAPFTNVEFSCAQHGVRTATVSVPRGSFDRVILAVTIRPDGDPWDRVFGVAIDGVEVLRGTTPRTTFTIRKDITEFATLLPPGGTADISLMSGSFVGRLLETVRIELYAHEPTAVVARKPASEVVPSFLWQSLNGAGARAGATTTFGPRPRSASVELTLSGHGQSGEFWYLDNPVPRAFHILVGHREIAVARSMPYVYALFGFGNVDANTACDGPGTSALGEATDPLLWWTAQRALDLGGIHTGVGEIPPYRARVRRSDLHLLTGQREVKVVQQGGGSPSQHPQNWITSLSFLIRR